jgi:hypothetical protein
VRRPHCRHSLLPGLAATAALVSMAPWPAAGQQHIALPPVNLGETSFMDGQGGPGLLTHVPAALYRAPRFTGPSGETLSGSNTLVTLSELTHLGYSPPIQVLGGYWGVEVLVPVVFVDMTTPAGEARAAGLGDIIFSPLVFQFANTTFLGGQFFHRLDVDVNAPTGEYRQEAPVSVGNHVWGVNPYYAFTWLPLDIFETSWRIEYLWNSVNDAPGPGYAATTIQPGQAFFFNGAFSVEATKLLRTGVAGYFLQQTTDSRADGHAVAGSRERVAALGPGFFALVGSTQLLANAYWEFAVENRPAGARLNLAALHVW